MSHIFVIQEYTGKTSSTALQPEHLTVDDLINLGRTSEPLAQQNWTTREGERKTAFLSFSSGTSGLPVRTSESILGVGC